MTTVLAIVVASCGGDSSTTTTTAAPTTTTPTTTVAPTTTEPPATVDPAALLDAVVATIDNESSPDELQLDADEARCIGEATFDEIGADRWVELGVTADGEVQPFSAIEDIFTEAEWTVMVDGLFRCVDVAAKASDSLVLGGIERDVAECAIEQLAETEALRDLIQSRDPEDPAGQAAFGELQFALTDCSL